MLAILLLLPLQGSPSSFPIRIPGTSAVPELGCRLPRRATCVICKCQASFPKFLHKAPKIPRRLMGALSRVFLGAQGEGEALCRAHMSCEADLCQGLEQMRPPWLLQPGSTWPPVASRLCTGHQAPGTAPGSLNLLPALGDPTSPDPAGSSRSQASDPPSMQMTLMETRRLPHSTQDSLEKWLPEVSHHYLRAPSRVLLPLQLPHALLGPGQPHGAALAEIPWRITHHSGFGSLPEAPALLMLQPKGFCQGMQEGPYKTLQETAPWKGPGSPPAWHWAWFDDEGAGWVLRLLSPEPRALLMRSCQRESAAPT